MTQLSVTRSPPSRTEQPAGEEARSLASLLVPLVGSLLQTYGLLWLICGTPYAASLRWAGWLRTAFSFLIVAFAAHVAAVWVNRRLFRGVVDAPGRLLVVTIWPSVVWLPLLILLTREQSWWGVLVPGLIVVSAVSALQRWVGGTAPAAESRTVATLFCPGKPRPFLWALAPALACSAACHAAVAETLRAEPLQAGWLLAGGVGLCLWRYPLVSPRQEEARAAGRMLVPRTLLVWLLLLVALLPYVGSKRLALAFGGALGARAPRAGAGKGGDRADGQRRDGSYSGVILLFSARPHRRIVAPPPPVLPVHAGMRERRPVVIPFDGAYWYFKLPDERPRADAPVVRGDPRRKSIRSTDWEPLAMEAHQRIEPPMPMSCCRAIRLVVENGDVGRGAIRLEVTLRDRMTRGRAVVSLGSQALPSSMRTTEAVGEPASAETLLFPFPAAPARPQMKSFDEITVAIRPRYDRARAGAHVAIESFELLP